MMISVPDVFEDPLEDEGHSAHEGGLQGRGVALATPHHLTTNTVIDSIRKWLKASSITYRSPSPQKNPNSKAL